MSREVDWLMLLHERGVLILLRLGFRRNILLYISTIISSQALFQYLGNLKVDHRCIFCHERIVSD